MHTKHTESFHNSLKIEIKAIKGTKTNYRARFFCEFIRKLDKRRKVVEELFLLIKV